MEDEINQTLWRTGGTEANDQRRAGCELEFKPLLAVTSKCESSEAICWAPEQISDLFVLLVPKV